MKITYLFHDSGNTSTYYGTGSVESFGVGISTTSHPGTFTNTATRAMVGPIFVLAALTKKSSASLAKMSTRIGQDVPVNCFYFIPSVAHATWSQASQNDGRFWSSLPLFRLSPGKTYKGYYVPLTALPPFGSRAEVGTVLPDTVTMRASDYFKAAAAYFDTSQTSFDGRILAGSSIVTVSGGDTGDYAMGYVTAANANVSMTFSQMIYQAIGSAGTPTLRAHVTGVAANSAGGFVVFITIKTDALNGKPAISVKSKTDIDDTGRHGLDVIGNSGFTNNRDISLDSVIVKNTITPNIEEIRVNNKARTVAGVDYYAKNQTRVNLYLSF